MVKPIKDELRSIKGFDVLQYSRLLKSISNPARLWILTLLIERERNVKELEDVTGMNQPNISRYLQSLLENGLIERRKDGVRTFYSVSNDENVVGILQAVRATVRKRQAG